MALDLTAEQKATGRRNFEATAGDLTRRGFMKSMAAGAAVVVASVVAAVHGARGGPVVAHALVEDRTPVDDGAEDERGEGGERCLHEHRWYRELRGPTFIMKERSPVCHAGPRLDRTNEVAQPHRSRARRKATSTRIHSARFAGLYSMTA